MRLELAKVLLIFFILCVSAGEAGALGDIAIKETFLGTGDKQLPVEIVKIAGILHPTEITINLVFLQVKVNKPIESTNVDIAVEGRNYYSNAKAVPFHIPTPDENALPCCVQWCTTYGSTFPTNGMLSPGKIYNIAFRYPSLKGYEEFDHILLTARQNGEYLSQSIWVYHTDGDTPSAGKEWDPRGVRS